MSHSRLGPARLFAACIVAVALPVLVRCASLSPLTPGVCGNGVVDPGEDCDGLVDGAVSWHGEHCGAANAGPLACRFECAGSSVCPPGYSCGHDLVCRAPVGGFSPLGSPLALGAEGVTLADFNGDGLADALTHGPINSLGGTRVQVNYLAADGSSLGVYGVEDRLSQPQVIDLNGDGIADVVATLRIGASSGVSVFLGQTTNALLPQPFPSSTIPGAALPSGATLRAYDITGFGEGPKTVYFLGTAGGTYPSGLYAPASGGLPDLSSPGASKMIPLPEGPDQMVGDAVLAQVESSPTACPYFIYATTAGAIRVLQPCQTSAAGVVTLFAGASVTTINLPVSPGPCGGSGGPACGFAGITVGDVDGDGNPDLILSAVPANAADYATFVAYGDGMGGFASGPPSDPNATPDVTSGPLSIGLRAQNGGLLPSLVPLRYTLAAGDVNGDGIADFVSSVTLYPTAAADASALSASVTLLVSGPVVAGANSKGTSYRASIGQFTWRSAAMADFNGDGTLDVVGAGADAGIDFFSGQTLPDGTYVGHHFAIPTGGTVSKLTAGDFDGDGLADVACQEADPAGDGTVDLALFYGTRSGAPASPRNVGHYASIAEIQSSLPYPLLELVASPLDAPSRLTVTRLSTGVGGRPPLSSQALVASGSGSAVPPEVALSAIAASFTGASGGDAGALLAVAAVGQEGATNQDYLWLLPQAASASSAQVTFAAARPNASVPATNFAPNPMIGATTNQALLLAAAPLTGSGPASLVAAVSASDAPQHTALLIAKVNGSTLSPLNVDSSGAAPVLRPSVGGNGPTYIPIAPDGQMALTDLDGDGYPDLVLLAGTNDFCGVVTQPARSLLVFWGDGQGGFDLASPATVASCTDSACPSSPGSSCPQAFTTLPAGPGQLPTLAYVTHASVYITQFSAASGEHRSLLPVTRLSLPRRASDGGSPDAGSPLPSGLASYSGISSGDINGDGVPDLAVSARGSLYFFAGAAVNP